jgi:type IV secretory pathway VirB6-like protein
MTAIQNQRTAYVIALVFAAAVTAYAAISAGVVEATAFAPVFVAMYLLERKRST